MRLLQPLSIPTFEDFRCMKLPPLQPMSHSQVCVCGDVTIHPSAVIAPGVLLQAESNSRIIIAAGACIGMGTILHSDQGVLEVGEGANLGTGVLVVGKGKIGAAACVGSSTTLLNPSVQPHQVLPAGSLLGDASRKVSESRREQVDASQKAQPSTSPMPVSTDTAAPLAAELSSKEQTPISAQQEPAVAEEPVGQVYGRTYVNQLLVKLMPHRQQQMHHPQLDD